MAQAAALYSFFAGAAIAQRCRQPGLQQVLQAALASLVLDVVAHDLVDRQVQLSVILLILGGSAKLALTRLA